MNQFDLIPKGNKPSGERMSYTQMHQSDIPNYWTYAQKFLLADNMFSSEHGPSFPNHLYIMAADANGVINIPDIRGYNGWGCDDPPRTVVTQLFDTGDEDQVFPCFDIPVIVDELQSAGITWKFYAPGAGQPGYVFSTLNAINHIRNGPLWSSNVVPYTQFVTDALAGNLPAVMGRQRI